MVQWDSVEQLEQYQLRQCDHLPKLGTDSKLLAQFATLHRREKVFDLGCGVGSPLHACDFHVDEDCLPLGAALQAATALDFLKD